jgi:putative redox protein
LLVFHSPQDSVVGIDNAAAIYKAALHPKSFVSLDGADHLLSHTQDSLYVGNMIATWASRYIEREVEEPEAEGHVMVSLAEPGFTCKVKAGPHRLIADEPKRVGGLDMGPGPYEFVGIGLGACTAMTIRMYTERKGWTVDEVNVHVDHKKEKPSTPPAPGEKEVPVDVFERKIEILGKLDEEQRARILEIADRCPVHRTLEHSAVIRTEEFKD